MSFTKTISKNSLIIYSCSFSVNSIISIIIYIVFISLNTFLQEIKLNIEI